MASKSRTSARHDILTILVDLSYGARVPCDGRRILMLVRALSNGTGHRASFVPEQRATQNGKDGQTGPARSGAADCRQALAAVRTRDDHLFASAPQLIEHATRCAFASAVDQATSKLHLRSEHV